MTYALKMGDVKWKRRRWEEQQLQKVWTCKNFELCIGKISHAPFDKSWLGLAHLLSSYHIIIITVQQTSLTSYVTLMAWLRNFRRSPVAGVFWYLPETRSTGKLYISLLWFFFFVIYWDHVCNVCTFCILMLGKFNEFCGFERPWRHTI